MTVDLEASYARPSKKKPTRYKKSVKMKGVWPSSYNTMQDTYSVILSDLIVCYTLSCYLRTEREGERPESSAIQLFAFRLTDLICASRTLVMLYSNCYVVQRLLYM